MELSSSQIKKFLIFEEMELFSQKKKPSEKIDCIFSKESFSYISGNGPRKISVYFRKQNFLIYQETETLKNFLYFRK